ncbi:MAG: S8 family serine peptidase [Candidatus Eiseniibacteriota bacterium]
MSPLKVVLTTVLVASFATASVASAEASWLWDQNANKIDDRIETVELEGPGAAHVGNTLAGKLRFALLNATAPFEYGVYVGYDHHPTDADASALAVLGIPVQVRYESIDYIRSRVTFPQALQIAALPGVTRIETIPIFYPVNDIATRVLRARDSGGELFPSVWKHLGVTGRGVTVAIFDTGVNDAPDASIGYPGHESLNGKWVGGGSFFAGQPALNTPLDESENPRHAIDPELTYHGTHVAGTAIGSGGPAGVLGPGGSPGFYAGLAPDARLVDMKVLSDAGAGFGSADGLDWLIHNRLNDWGLTGPDSIYGGVDVANLSLGGMDESDGTDANCAAVNAAVRAGIVVCVASGNDGNTAFMVSPGAADLVVTVGSFTDNNTIAREDDVVADYSNEGPRNPDSDSDVHDEMKPNVLGSGTGILSALGDPTTDGNLYHHINGTSMACPSVAGIAALVRSANPGLSASEVRSVLEDTADHRVHGGKQPPEAVDPFGEDPNYHPSWGWGQTDAYAAVKEALNPATTQIVRVSATPQRGPDGVRVRWWSQREIGLTRYAVDRAPDSYGGPGAWTELADVSVPAPSTQIRGVPNRHPYEYTDLDPSLDPASTYWYRVRWLEGGISHAEPALAVRIDDSPVVARVRYSWTHDYSDGDLAVKFGTGTSTANPAWSRPGLGAPAADSIVTVAGTPLLGTLRHYFHVDLTAADLVTGFLPPGAANPWFLSVKEGGFLNTKGRVNDFSVTVFGPGGEVTYTAPNPVTETIEKQETVFWIPLDPVLALNHAPVFVPVGDRSVGEGLPVDLTVTANDADGQPLVYGALDLPPGASFNAGTRRFLWTPTHAQAGSYTVRFTARDNAFPVAAADTERVAITVLERAPGENLPPLLDEIADRQAFVGEPLSFRVMARDPEGAALQYAMLLPPNGATLDPVSGVFEWTPTLAEFGPHELRLTATDPGALADTVIARIEVAQLGAGPLPPVSCEESADHLEGMVDAGAAPLFTSEQHIPFTAPAGIQRIEATLTWFGGPAVDLDFYLLDADSNVVQSAGSTNPSEHLVYATPEPGNYIWRIVSYTNPDTANFAIDMTRCIAPVVAVEDGAVALAPTLSFATPNPFRTTTRVALTLPRSGTASLRIYNVAGRLVRTLVDGPLAAGVHTRVWDGRGDSGVAAAPGMYFYRFRAEGRTLGQKVLFVP